MPFKIHPGLGVARAGDSPTDWFIGPETADEPVPPPGGYKDSECRIKRQAARFRIWRYNAAGTALGEFTLLDGTITWSVKLGTAATAITTISGPNQLVTLPGTPSFGELRTDGEGRLIVLSGVVTATFNARCDGWIKADITPNGDPLEAALGSWMAVGPPDYAPCVRPVLNVHARLQQLHIDSGVPIPVPSSPSFLREIYPILKGGAGTTALNEAGFPSLADQAARMAVASPFVTNMPGNFREVTVTQRAMLDSWVNGSFTNDWANLGTPIPIDPVELDRGPISHSLQRAGAYEFGPGIADGTIAYVEPYRPDVNATAHGSSVSGLLEWKSDAQACVLEWPSQSAAPTSLGPAPFWHTRGFMVRDGAGTKYIEECSGMYPYIMLLTPTVDFGDVAQAPGGGTAYQSAAIVFETSSLASAVTFTSGASPTPSLTSPVSSFVVGPQAAGVMETKRLWLTYQTGAAGDTIDVVITVTESGGATHDVRVLARTVASQTTKLAFVLDASGSMNENRGDGASKLQGLKDAMDVAIDVARENDGIGLAPYNHDALGTLAVTRLGPNVPLEPNRESVRTAVSALTAGGSTSIGDGIVSGRAVLAAPPIPAAATFNREALIVVTDGKENSSLFIDDVASSIDQRTFAIGIGTGSNINVSTLQRLSGNTGGYFLLTGAVTGDNRYELQKYLLQILAEVNNDQIVLDPSGVVHPGSATRVPFPMTETDRMLEAIVLTNEPKALDVTLHTPRGDVIKPATVTSLPRAVYVESSHALFYRLELPVTLGALSSHGGKWAVVLSTRDKRGHPYAVIVNTRSEIVLRADLRRAEAFAGGRATVDAWLTQFGAPFERPARVLAHWTRPSGAHTILTLTAEEPGHYSAQHVVSEPGLHRIRISADGRSEEGFVFKRELSRTLYAAAEEIHDSATGTAAAGHRSSLDCVLCALLKSPGFRAWLDRVGVDAKALSACCRDRLIELDAERERQTSNSDRSHS